MIFDHNISVVVHSCSLLTVSILMLVHLLLLHLVFSCHHIHSSLRDHSMILHRSSLLKSWSKPLRAYKRSTCSCILTSLWNLLMNAGIISACTLCVYCWILESRGHRGRHLHRLVLKETIGIGWFRVGIATSF